MLLAWKWIGETKECNVMDTVTILIQAGSVIPSCVEIKKY